MVDKHMGVAEVKRRFADVIGEVMHAGRRIIVERRGRPVVAIVPIDHVTAAGRPGQRLAATIGCGEEDGESFRELMRSVTLERRGRPPRRVMRSEGR
jgi:prevent-host-death family protein